MDIQEYISSGIIEQYVLGLCTASEEREVEQLRLQHPALNEAIIRFETELEIYLQQQSIAPAAETDAQILQQLASLQTPVVSLPANTSVVKTGNWMKWVAAASVVLLAISSYFNFSLFKTTKDQQAALETAKKNTQVPTLPAGDYKILNDPRITPVAMYGVGSHTICRCTLYWDKKTGKAYIMIHHLPQSSDQQDYQLWAMINGKPVNVGIINDAIRGRFIEVTNVPADATGFAVTLEKAGGNTTPTLEQMYLMGKI
jgi:anti-sigma-K factor RskA